ncbi:MAG: DUF3501 family protein [Rickettsiales bacterium TMED254]|nr:hypothetical protein [Rickettsiales bacterium]RPF77521.1 MAG: DUF3501 family protein [Rickettsiales bacterium TMED254]|tara:strand:+ start:240 stop:824 length:585 start_codon:yes stop_codon:yes gene_type:complete
MNKFIINESDIVDIDTYIKNRSSIKKNIFEIKKNRRVQVGPHATFYFESYDTMLYQIQEMIYIERGGREQLLDELKAYNPMVPNGSELVATLMFEIGNENKRKEFLNSAGGIENKIYFSLDKKVIVKALPEDDTERTNEYGKTSSVHFLHFNFENHIEEFKNSREIIIGFEHKNYKHTATISESVKKSLVKDFK